MREERCRSCGSTDLAPILSIGETPLADRLLTPEMLCGDEQTAPLELVLCRDCALAQINETVDPEILFGGDYPYFSSVSATLLRHSAANADELIQRLQLDAGSFVLEIASNDGYMLRNFVARGIPVLGVDPAAAPADAARRAGVPTREDFFSRDLAEELRRTGLRADLIIANNVLAHVADLNGLVAGIATLLKTDGLAVLEMPYLGDLLAKYEFDTIYHQHLCYFSLTALKHLFSRHGLIVKDVRRLDIHGGSLRIFVGHQPPASAAVDVLLAEEAAARLDHESAFADFTRHVVTFRSELRAALDQRKTKGERIAGYGAAAKATTLLSYCGIGRETLDYIVDRNPFKHGRYMPGNRLPIVPTERLVADRPDAVLLLTWNFAEEIIEQQAEYLNQGGQMILPVPGLGVVSSSRDIPRVAQTMSTAAGLG